MTLVAPCFSLAIPGSSFIGGRLNGDMIDKLARELALQPEAVGPVRLHNYGQGGWNSTQIRTTSIPRICLIRPTHVFYDTGAINSCVDFGGWPAVDRAQHITDVQLGVAALQAAVPGIDITLMTMSSISAAVAVGRPAYDDYNADVVAQAALLGLDCLNLRALWPSPLDPTLTYGAGAWAVTPTATFDPMPDGTVFNPGDKTAGVTLSDAINEAVATTAGAGGIRAATAITGKMRFEVQLLGKSAGFPGVGVANAAADLTAGVGGAGDSLAMDATGNVYRAGAFVGPAGFVPASGDVIGVEIDRGANLAYFQKGAIRSAGMDISGVAGAIYPVLFVNAKGTGGTARFTPSGDGLHPLAAALDAYSAPALKAHTRAKMAAHFGLA